MHVYSIKYGRKCVTCTKHPLTRFTSTKWVSPDPPSLKSVYKCALPPVNKATCPGTMNQRDTVFTHSLSLRHSRLPFVPQARVYSSWRIPSEFHLRPPARSVPCARRGLWITSLLLWVFQKREDSRVQKITVTSTSELIVSDEKIKKSCVSCWYFLCWKGGLIAVTSITHWEHKVKQQIRKWRIHIPPRLKGVQEASIQWLKCKTAVQNMQGS